MIETGDRPSLQEFHYEALLKAPTWFVFSRDGTFPRPALQNCQCLQTKHQLNKEDCVLTGQQQLTGSLLQLLRETWGRNREVLSSGGLFRVQPPSSLASVNVALHFRGTLIKNSWAFTPPQTWRWLIQPEELHPELPFAQINPLLIC